MQGKPEQKQAIGKERSLCGKETFVIKNYFPPAVSIKNNTETAWQDYVEGNVITLKELKDFTRTFSNYNIYDGKVRKGYLDFFVNIIGLVEKHPKYEITEEKFKESLLKIQEGLNKYVGNLSLKEQSRAIIQLSNDSIAVESFLKIRKIQERRI